MTPTPRKSKTEALKKFTDSLKKVNRKRKRTPVKRDQATRRLEFSNPKKELESESELETESELNFESESESEVEGKMALDPLKFRKCIDSMKEFDGKQKGLTRFFFNVESLFKTIPEGSAEADVTELFKYVINRLCPIEIFNRVQGKAIVNLDGFKKIIADAVVGPIDVNEVTATLTATVQQKSFRRSGIEGNEAEKLKDAIIFNAFMKNIKPDLNKICLSKNFLTMEQCVEDIAKLEQLINPPEIDNLTKMFESIINSQQNNNGGFRNQNA